jgi:hypothetical protein
MTHAINIPRRRPAQRARAVFTILPALGLLILLSGCDESQTANVTIQPGSPRPSPQAAAGDGEARDPSQPSTPATMSGQGSTAADTTNKSPANSSSVPYLSAKIKVKTGSGSTEMSLKPKDDGAKLVDPAEQELARYNIQGEKLKIKDPQDKVLGYVVGAAPRFKVEDPTQQQILFKLIGQDDGDWKLEDAQDTLLVKIKKRAYGFEIEDPAEKSLYKIKVDGAKTSIRDASDQTIRYTNDPVHPLAFACLVLDAITDVRVRGGLLVAVQQVPLVPNP